MKVLVTGAAGFLGSSVLRRLHVAGHSPTAGIHRSVVDNPPGLRTVRCDVTDPTSIRQAAEGHDAVVNTAYVQSGERAWVTNVDGAANTALVCADLRIRLVHISSDVVFSGSPGTYKESAPCDPVHGYEYGEQKAEAERRVRELCNGATILRTSLLYSSDGTGPLNRVVRDSLSDSSGVVHFTDEFRCPAQVEDVTAAVVAAIPLHDLPVLHAGGPDLLSRFEIAVRLARRMGLDATLVQPGSAESIALRRPRRLQLDSSLAESRLGWSARRLQDTA